LEKSGRLSGSFHLSPGWYCGFINHRLATTLAIRGAFPFLFLLLPYFNIPARVRFACSRDPSIDADEQGVLSGIANVLASCAVQSFCLPVVVLVSLSLVSDLDSSLAHCLATFALSSADDAASSTVRVSSTFSTASHVGLDSSAAWCGGRQWYGRPFHDCTTSCAPGAASILCLRQ
jgi:hypothetical protein